MDLILGGLAFFCLVAAHFAAPSPSTIRGGKAKRDPQDVPDEVRTLYLLNLGG